MASTRQLGYLLDSVYQLPMLQVLNACGEKLLTSREEQVVALVADGSVIGTSRQNWG
jgi:hypothetical protein